MASWLVEEKDRSLPTPAAKRLSLAHWEVDSHALGVLGPFLVGSVSSSSISNMVRLFSLSLLAVFAGAALAGSSPEQQVLGDTSVQFSDKWSYVDCGGNMHSSLKNKRLTDRQA